MTKKKSLINAFKRKSIDEASHFYAGQLLRAPRMQSYIVELNDDDDTKSIESFSTTATVDNNPGTGRVLDTYFFQPAGRRIERLAMRFTIRHLHPWRIEAFIHQVFPCYPGITSKRTLSFVFQHISDRHNSGRTVISGLNSLVRQAQ